MRIWQSAKGYVAGAVALIACPCHLPITLPLLAGLTAGTALGGWLAGNYLIVAILSTVTFIVGLVLSFSWLGNQYVTRTSGAAGSARGDGLTVTLVTSKACQPCDQARKVWEEVLQGRPVKLEVIEINSPQGRRLAARHSIFATPTTLFNGQVALAGVPSLEEARRAVEGA